AALGLGAAVERVLEAHLRAAGDRFKGIRHMTSHDPAPELKVVSQAPAGLMKDAVFRQGFGRLARLGLVFDAFVLHHQLEELAGLAAAFSGTTIVFHHAGGAVLTGPYAGATQGGWELWVQGSRQRSVRGNVGGKGGGVG